MKNLRMYAFFFQWDLVCDRSWLPTFTLVLFGIGEFLSMPLYFYVTYRYEKKIDTLNVYLIKKIDKNTKILVSEGR